MKLTSGATRRKRLAVPNGLHANRLALKADNPREVAFMAQWKKEHEFYRHDLLALILAEKKPPTEHERIVVSTIIQWLGSNVGISFLAEALREFGYRIIKIP